MLCFSTDMSWIPKRALGRIDRKKLDIFRKHATTLKIKPTSNDLTTLNIIGKLYVMGGGGGGGCHSFCPLLQKHVVCTIALCFGG